MKQIIDSKRYDTEKARCIGEHSYSNRQDFHYIHEGLYVTAKGQYFVAGEGGAATHYSEAIGTNSREGGQRIIPMCPAEALEWAQEHLEADEVESEFGDDIEDA